MTSRQLSDLQRVNLSMLLTMRDNIHQDRVSACCKYGLHVDQAQCFAGVSIEQILAIVANVGEECLFLPRQDLFELLKVPAPLTGAFVSVRPLTNETASHRGSLPLKGTGR